MTLLSSDELKLFDELKKVARKASLDYTLSNSVRNELADMYEQWLNTMKKHNPNYDEVVFCVLPNIAIKRKDIPKLIREGSKDVETFIRILAG